MKYVLTVDIESVRCGVKFPRGGREVWPSSPVNCPRVLPHLTSLGFSRVPQPLQPACRDMCGWGWRGGLCTIFPISWFLVFERARRLAPAGRRTRSSLALCCRSSSSTAQVTSMCVGVCENLSSSERVEFPWCLTSDLWGRWVKTRVLLVCECKFWESDDVFLIPRFSCNCRLVCVASGEERAPSVEPPPNWPFLPSVKVSLYSSTLGKSRLY